MKYFLNPKCSSSKVSKVVFSLILLFSSFLWSTSPFLAFSNPFIATASTSSSSANISSSPSTSANPNCKCRHPFKRFISALRILESENLLSPDDFKKLLAVLDQVPRETLNKVEDKDLALAHTLYQDKVLTEAQYQRLLELFKTTLKKN